MDNPLYAGPAAAAPGAKDAVARTEMHGGAHGHGPGSGGVGVTLIANVLYQSADAVEVKRTANVLYQSADAGEVKRTPNILYEGGDPNPLYGNY